MLLPPMNAVRMFESAARHLSFSLAADELHVTPSAVSHQIKHLEEFLGIKLFHRKTRQIELTAEAESFLTGIRAGLKEISEATRRIQEKTSDTILLNSAPAFASSWLIPRLYDFYQRYPDTEVQLVTSMDLVDFKRSPVDMAVRYGRGEWSGLQADLIVSEELVPVCCPSRLAKDQPQKPADLLHLPLLQVEQKLDDWVNWFRVVGIDLDGPVTGQRYQTSPLLMEAAMGGLGYAITNREFADRELASGRLVIPFDVGAYSGCAYYLVYPMQQRLSPRLLRFRDWVLSQAEMS